MALLALALLSLYRPENWQFFPSMDEVRCLSSSQSRLYVAVPAGVYIFDRTNYRYERCLTRSDGLTGEVRLCAHAPGRNDLLIATEDRLYRFAEATSRLTELPGPFGRISSIGTKPDAVWLDTDAGWFARYGTSTQFVKVAGPPEDATWYGDRDTSKPRDFPFLTPYFVTDDQLVMHNITLVRPDRTGRRLFAFAPGYGVIVYNSLTGFSEARIHVGPGPTATRRIVSLDGRLWLLGPETNIALAPDGNWDCYLTRPGTLPTTGFRLLLGNVADLERGEGITSLFALGDGLLLGTGRGVYRLGRDAKLHRLVELPKAVNGLVSWGDSILFGTDQGLFLLAEGGVKESADPYGRTDWGVYDIARSGTGTVWFGTLGGVVSRRPDGSWYRYVPPGSNLKSPVRALAAAGARAFIASGSTVMVFDTRDESWTAIDSSRGIPRSDITALYADDHYLWMASPGLIARLDYARELK
jgi:hypothetical protein